MGVTVSRLLGLKGVYLSACKTLHRDPYPINVPIFGRITLYDEILNLQDNFGRDELRDPEVEQLIKASANPVVIDCGVNVGITVRWWFHLNPRARVYGIDMMEEAQQVTLRAVPSGVDYRPITRPIYSQGGVEFEIDASRPLFGGNSIEREIPTGEARRLTSTTLDELFGEADDEDVVLLKVDLEGSGHHALRGGQRLLSRARHVAFEIHDEAESREASRLLASSGFELRRVTRRNLWWVRA